ncbi:MAG: NADH-ubiquinone oxidoreductase-F iron-sulfur binding region domain-containing protein [Planctomycetota bacterium]|jgi:NADH:ubiquinone oxidoreductase subunit F (NADH-binding)
MNLIEELYALQEAHGYLREEDLRALSRRTKVPLYEIEGVSSFYPHFRGRPPPRVHVTACRDLSCHLRGAGPRHLKALCARHSDVEFHEVSCLGRCDAAPACTVNDVPVAPDDVAGYLADLSTLPADEPTDRPRRWKCDPYATPAEHYGVLREILTGGRDLDAMIRRIKDAGLRGMGGAGFPVGLKWALVRRETASPKYVICNADESEPGTFKDRVILEELPHLVIEGMVLGALAVGAHEGWVYIRHEYTKEAKAIRRAIREAQRLGVLGDRVCGTDFGFDVKVFVSPGGYILGEETALIEALEGKRGEPRNKPPYPGTIGLHGKPTLINNVESLALVPHVLRSGRHDLKFFSVSGDVERPGVHEVPIGTSLRQLIERCGGVREGKELLAFQPGGASTEFLPADRIDVVMDWQPLQEAGSSLGAGSVVIVGEGRDMLDLARNLTAFFRNESCGKCVPCRVGTEKAVVMIQGRRAQDLALMSELHETLAATSICGLGQAALNPIRSVLERFPDAAQR